MSSKSMTARGTKRRCQSQDCGLPFYDLNRTEMTCPVCGAAFDLAAAMRIVPTVPARAVGRKPGRYFPAAAPLAPVPSPVADADADTIDPIDPVDAEEIEVEEVEDTGAEIATVETILEDEDDPVDAIVDVVPEDEGRPDE